MSVRTSTRTFFATCFVFLGLFAFSFLPVLTQGQGDGNGGGNSKTGQVDGHCEGPNPVAGIVCVDLDGSHEGLDECDEKYKLKRERTQDSTTRQGGDSLTVENPNDLKTATFTVYAGSSLQDIQNNAANRVGHDEIEDRPCKEIPLEGAGMALCQNPEENEETERFNVYWTDRADANDNNKGGDREEQEGDDGTTE